LQSIASDDYLTIAQGLLAERQQAELPPYHALALLQADAPTLEMALHWLNHCRQWAEALLASLGAPPLRLSGPLPALMERRAGRYRAQLHISAANRGHLRQLLSHLLLRLDQQRRPSGLRWSVDVDPVDLL